MPTSDSEPEGSTTSLVIKVEREDSSQDTLQDFASEEVKNQGRHIKRDIEFWFEDGTVIVVVQDVEFKVYKGLLVSRFSVFQTLLSLSQSTPSSGSTTTLVKDETTVLECPVIHLYGDTARDWRILFRLFMPQQDSRSVSYLAGLLDILVANRPDSLFKSSVLPATHSFEVTSACVRLGHKYHMPGVYQQAMRYLKDHFTHDHDRWDSQPTYLPPGFEERSPIGVVNLARLTGELTLLPVALWMCCRLGAEITEGLVYSDGERETLSPEDMGRCFVGRTKLVQEGLLNLDGLFAAPATTCERADSTAKGCKERMAIARNQYCTSRLTSTTSMAISPFTAVKVRPGVKLSGLCDPCISAVKEKQKEQRTKTWKNLPSLLSIEVPGW